ncbi:UNVERIFIED_CONTAM: hypothetical protein FKN15_037306 [Acipenser sinensis]
MKVMKAAGAPPLPAMKVAGPPPLQAAKAAGPPPLQAAKAAGPPPLQAAKAARPPPLQAAKAARLPPLLAAKEAGAPPLLAAAVKPAGMLPLLVVAMEAASCCCCRCFCCFLQLFLPILPSPHKNEKICWWWRWRRNQQACSLCWWWRWSRNQQACSLCWWWWDQQELSLCWCWWAQQVSHWREGAVSWKMPQLPTDAATVLHTHAAEKSFPAILLLWLWRHLFFLRWRVVVVGRHLPDLADFQTPLLSLVLGGADGHGVPKLPTTRAPLVHHIPRADVPWWQLLLLPLLLQLFLPILPSPHKNKKKKKRKKPAVPYCSTSSGLSPGGAGNPTLDTTCGRVTLR